MRGDPQAELVRLVDDGAVDFGGQLLVLAVPGVDPDFYDIDLVRGELLHCLAAFGLGRDPVRHRQAPGFGHGDPAPRAEEPRGARYGLPAHVEQLVVVRAEAERGAHAEIRAPLQVAGEQFARRAETANRPRPWMRPPHDFRRAQHLLAAANESSPSTALDRAAIERRRRRTVPRL